MQINKGNKTAILYGGSGLVGSHCLEVLLDSDAYTSVKVFVRKKLPISHEKLIQFQIDFDNLIDEVWDHMTGDDIFVCLGTTIKKAGSQEAFYRVDYKYVVLIAEMGHRKGASQLMLVSSVGADSTSKIFYKKVKGEVEEEVLRMPYWAIHIFRPSLLLGKRKEFRLGEKVATFIGKRAKKVGGNFMGKFQPIEASIVATYMIDVAQNVIPGSHLHLSNQMIKAYNNE